MKWYALAKPSGNLFVHFDKNIYSNNETVYFTGYLIKEAKTPANLHKVMAVALIRDVDSALIMDDKFIMNKGLSFGSLTLPDSIPTGNYHFLVYTDKLMNQLPEVLFIQNITIKSSIEPTFNANVKLIDQPKAEATSVKVLVSARAIDGRFLSRPSEITYTYGNVRKSTITDASGQAMLTLPIQSNTTDPNLYVKLKYVHDSTFINIALPQPKNKAIVKFYPEGGNLVLGLASTMGWEVKDKQNRPIALKAFLFKNQEVIDTIETTSYGIGKFLLKPEIGCNYTLKLLHSNLADTLYHLPMALEKGLVITLEKALVDDTLRINLKSTEKSKINVLVHNYKTCFINTPFITRIGNTLIKIPLDDMPKGLTTLTIIDSLNRPLAERIFFAHYNNSEKIIITSDKEIYNQREKVNLKLKLNFDNNALVSIAAVQNNRLEFSKTTDIESYAYLINALSTLPLISNGRPYKDRNYLEQMLLVKGWRRYTWQDLNMSRSGDTLSKIDSLGVGGQVRRQKKEVTAPLIIGTMGSQSINLITTTSKGFFNFEENQLITLPTKKMYAFVNGAQKLPYEVNLEINDQFSTMNQKMAKSMPNNLAILPSNLINNTELLLKNNEKSIRLKEVIISNKNDSRFKFSGANACGDYVCEYNILNCRNHTSSPNKTQPIKGHIYSESGTNMKIVYGGCTVPEEGIFKLVKGIHLEKEFYNDDYKNPNEPAFFSTIYWSYGTLLNAKKETELSFYTSDITGKFRIVVQGVTEKGVVYAEHLFEVKGKQ
ncbi:hypothetical protein WG904_08820 [Pedobacter sp. Du54]|uniref:hypothetical protein n=1 Tax=Pedobacter anseongensis TaxID=3133439 RepID=UPI0030982E2B